MCSCLLLFYIASTQPSCCSDGCFEDFPREFDEFYAMLFYIASTQPSCCSDGCFEDFPREFDEFYASMPPVSFLWRRPFPLLVLAFVTTMRLSVM
jgi:hypothetical protein